jgi:hypothetical protein
MTAVNDLDTATAQRERKEFATLVAHFALLGYVLIKGDPAIDGQAPYFAARWGMGAQPLASLEAADLYLVGLLGAGDGGG